MLRFPAVLDQPSTDTVYWKSIDATNSGGSNLGPLNAHLLTGNGTQVTVAPGTPPPPGDTPVPGKPNTYRVPGTYVGVPTYAAQFRAENSLAPDTPLPADIVTATGSGLDPDISVAAAELRVKRIVAARQALGGRNVTITTAAVRSVIAQVTVGPATRVPGRATGQRAGAQSCD